MSTLSLFVPLVSSPPSGLVSEPELKSNREQSFSSFCFLSLVIYNFFFFIFTQRNYIFKNLIVFCSLTLNFYEGLSKKETFALARSAIEETFAEDEVKQELILRFDSASPEYV